ncbi:BnaC02g24250D [Brassica napus]|uniref:BnaC02g24250D protein n=1 Tax=Brassica napus TaxID=3708 RepID=A0A078G4N7_BRANA|nr:BnaC02g24250D [Brassica napus]
MELELGLKTHLVLWCFLKKQIQGSSSSSILKDSRRKVSRLR